jgi:hypothetical protein
VVAVLLLATSASSGAVVGFAAGAVWSVLADPLSWLAVVLVTGGAVVLDASCVPALSIRRQVPQLWGRIFPAPTVAVLYGARLGVGPLTILRTWLWWSALVVGASAGPWWSAAVGATFGLGRVAAMLGAGTRAGALQRDERRWTIGLAAFAMAVVLAPAVVADSDEAEMPPRTGPGTQASRDAPVDPSYAGRVTAPPSTTAPVVAPPDRGLGALLPLEVLPGFERIPDDPARRIGPLDLATAAGVESDEPAERALLETRRFSSGHARAWRDGAGRVAYASVYEFASPADAEAYRGDGLTTIEGRGARLYDLEVPAGGRGFSQAEQARAGAGSTVAHGVVFVRGARFFLVFVTSPDSSMGTADAAAVAGAVASTVGG